MKVLLLGEFSSLHRYLKEGLQELGGIDVKLFANGDSWKKIGGADGSLFNYYGGIPGRIKTYGEALKNARAFEGYDVVQLMNSAGEYYHTLIITGFDGGEILVSAHTNDALDRPLSTYPYFTVRIIHILGARIDLDTMGSFTRLINGEEIVSI